MALSCDQIKKWSRRGDPIHAWYWYEMVQGSLTQGKLEGTWSVYPQGSYANKTNIAADSDVNLVVALTSSFYPNKKELSPIEREEYDKYYERAERTWRDFRDAVTRILRQNFWVVEGSKAVKVRSGSDQAARRRAHRAGAPALQEASSASRGRSSWTAAVLPVGDHKMVNFPKHTGKPALRRSAGPRRTTGTWSAWPERAECAHRG